VSVNTGDVTRAEDDSGMSLDVPVLILDADTRLSVVGVAVVTVVLDDGADDVVKTDEET
jgi:hypothetical protein